MTEVLEIEEIATKMHNTEENKIASWLINIPENIIEALYLPEGSQIALTVKNSEVSGTILPPMSPGLKKIGSRILKKRRGLYEELKRIGD